MHSDIDRENYPGSTVCMVISNLEFSQTHFKSGYIFM